MILPCVFNFAVDDGIILCVLQHVRYGMMSPTHQILANTAPVTPTTPDSNAANAVNKTNLGSITPLVS